MQLNEMKLDSLKLTGSIQLTSNGENAKTAKVKLVARSSEPIFDPSLGMFVNDFSGMRTKSRIYLDWEHGTENGYLNHFDVSSGELVCSGVLVITDDASRQLAEKMAAGVPYQASIEFSADEGLIEYVPDGATTTVNGRSLSGPLMVVREWDLLAVAICKYGRDANTSSTISASAKKSSEQTKGYYIRLSNSNKGKNMNDTIKSTDTVTAEPTPTVVDEVKTVEATAEVTPVVAVEASAEVKADEVKTVEPVGAEATATATVVDAVDASKSEDETKVEATPVEAEPLLVAASNAVVEPTANPSDARAEFKAFVAAFGSKAPDYFAQGLSFSDATAAHLKHLSEENANLTKRLSALDRGAAKPVTFTASADATDSKPTLRSLVRIHGS